MKKQSLSPSGYLRDALIQALYALRENRLRTSLSIMGVMVGVLSVIAVGVVTKGVREKIFAELESYGLQTIWVYRDREEKGPYADVREGTGIDNDDLEGIRLGCCSAVLRASPRVYYDNWNVLLRAGNRFHRAYMEGIDMDYLDITKEVVELGRGFRPADIEQRRPVAVIGPQVQKELFGDHPNPVGETLRHDEIKFTVIGVLKEKKRDFLKSIGASENYDINNRIMIPYTLHQQMLGSKEIHTLVGEAVDGRSIQEAMDQIADLMRRQHNGKFSYITESMEGWINTADRMLTNITLIGVVAASISLFVGGIGIMNIMTTSVVERTREIGIRKAIGAQRRDILFQFLSEAVFISTLGGLLGVASGLALSYAVESWMQLSVMPSLWVVLVALFVSAGVGIASGYYPAVRASRLKPVEALRFD